MTKYQIKVYEWIFAIVCKEKINRNNLYKFLSSKYTLIKLSNNKWANSKFI